SEAGEVEFWHTPEFAYPIAPAKVCANFFLLTSQLLVTDFASVGSVRPKVKAALRAAVPAGNYEQLYIRVFLPPPTRRIAMKIVRLLLSLVVFLQAVIALHGQITAAASSHADRGGFPIPSEYNRGQAGGAVASGQMRAAIASVPFFFEANQGQTDPRVRFFSRSRWLHALPRATRDCVARKRGPSGRRKQLRRFAGF